MRSSPVNMGIRKGVPPWPVQAAVTEFMVASSSASPLRHSHTHTGGPLLLLLLLEGAAALSFAGVASSRRRCIACTDAGFLVCWKLDK
jgi:hypothetical protein